MAIGTLTVIQGVLLHWGTKQITEIRPVPPSNEKFALVLSDTSADWLLDQLGLGSPTVFALPSPEGFSGEAWLRYRTPTTKPQPIEDVPTWFEMETNSFGNLFLGFLTKQAPAPMRVADLQVVWRDNFPIDPVPDRRSELRLEGDLISRRLLTPPALPTWPHTDVAAESHVQVLVDSEGRVLSAALLESQGRLSSTSLAMSSRVPAADAYALEFARAARFEPLSSERPRGVLENDPRLSSGRLIFQWTTIPIVNTNRAAF